MAAAWGGPVPWMLLEGLICEKFGWTLLELREQPSHDVLQMYLALNKLEEHRKPTV